MKNKLILIFSFVLVFFIGCIGMYLLIYIIPIRTQTTEKILNRYKIEESAITDAIEDVYDGVVVVESYSNNELIGTGTGFVYKKDDTKGYIITNSHVITDNDKIEITFSNNKIVTGILLGNDIYADIAVISVPIDSVLDVLEIGNSESMKLGTTLFTIGAPMGSDYSGTVTKGILSGKDRIVTYSLESDGTNEWMMRVLQTDAAINPGNSGGPLINLAGEVIGINSLKLVEDEVEGMGFAIPIEDAMKYVEQLEKGESISRPELGVELIDLTEPYALFIANITIDKSIENGVVIATVEKDSPADKISLKKGDIITKLGNIDVNNKAELRYELYKYKPGDKIDITIYRNKIKKVYEVVLADSNA